MLLRNARFSGGSIVDFLITDGVITSIAPSLPDEGHEVIELDGR